MRIIQISDSHLSPHAPQFHDNFRKIVAAVNEERPTLVINSGDVANDGPGNPEELAFAAREHRAIEAPLLAVPGNHDLGEEPPGQPAKQYVNDEWRAHWHRFFGHDWWALSLGAWRLLGINSQLMGSGIEAEEEQWQWLARELEDARDRPVGIFQHKPPFRENSASTAPGFREMTPAARSRYAAAIDGSTVRFFSCGHSHMHKAYRWLNRDVYWCPPTSAIEDAAQGPNGYPGYLRFDFAGEIVKVRFVFPLECERIDFNDMKAALGHMPLREEMAGSTS